MFQLTSVPELSDVVVTFLNSIVVLTPNGNFLGCANTTFGERGRTKMLISTFLKSQTVVEYFQT